MNRRLITVLLVALVVALICTWGVVHFVGVRIAASKPVETTKVISAKKDIPLGAVLTNEDLDTMTIAGPLPKGSILKAEDAIGRGVVTQISMGEPILESHLAGLGSGGGLAPTIPQGMRACAVKVDEVVGVAGFVLPGMRVDVLVSGNPPGANDGSQGIVTKTLLQNIQVLSAGQDIQRDSTGKPQQVQVVNLLVTPEQAQMLSLASNSLKIQLVLRNPLDTQIANVPSTAMGNLLSGQPAAPDAHPHAPVKRSPKPPSNSYSIQVFNGTKSTEEKFSSPEGQH